MEVNTGETNKKDAGKDFEILVEKTQLRGI